MKIMHLLNTDDYSGAENVVCQIFKMMENVPDVEMVYCSRDGKIRPIIEGKGIHYIPLQRFSVKEIAEVLRREKPDVLHTHDMRATFQGARACGGIPLVSHIHINNYNARSFTLKSLAYLFPAIKAKHIFWVSQSSFDGYRFHRFFEKKSTVLYNVIDVDDLYKRLDEDSEEYDLDVVYLGRIDPQKNPLRFVRIMRRVVDRLPNVKIGVVGWGTLEDEMQEAFKTLGLVKNLQWFGRRQNPYKILRSAKVILTTSLFEGTPMVALEALALGVPLVSTPVDGVKALVTNGENGFLSDNDSELAARVGDVIVDSGFHARLSSNAIEGARRYNSVEKYAITLSDVYRTACNF